MNNNELYEKILKSFREPYGSKECLEGLNEWRKNYTVLTDEQQAKVYDDMEIYYPEQVHYNLEFAKQVFDVVKPKIVTEIGGWKGDLACEMLKEDYNIEKWYNVEISQNAIDKTKCKDQRHEYIKPDSFNWFHKIEMRGMIVSTHFIEHLSNQDFETFCSFIKEIEYIYFEAPLEDDGQTWENYGGTHILTYGWNKVKELLNSHEVILENNYCKLFKKR